MGQGETDDVTGLLAAPIPRRRAISLVAGSLLGGALGLRSQSVDAAAHAQPAILDGSSMSNHQGGRAGNALFGGFTPTRVTTTGAEINVVYGGSGPPVLLLHGAPQTHAMWHAVAPRLAEHHTVVAADLRGYGDSSKPPGGGDHADYSFRAMAADQLEVMHALGHERFALVGHDRGARVAHRLALDHPDAVERMAVLDIVPTSYVYAHPCRAGAVPGLLVHPRIDVTHARGTSRRPPAGCRSPTVRSTSDEREGRGRVDRGPTHPSRWKR